MTLCFYTGRHWAKQLLYMEQTKNMNQIKKKIAMYVTSESTSTAQKTKEHSLHAQCFAPDGHMQIWMLDVSATLLLVCHDPEVL